MPFTEIAYQTEKSIARRDQYKSGKSELIPDLFKKIDNLNGPVGPCNPFNVYCGTD